jgi:hypothetical protein
MIDASEPKKGEVWHPWCDLEESESNMWGSVSHRETWLAIAVLFTGDHKLYGQWMRSVVDSWPKSCEHNLSKRGDKRPWIGHAAAALAINCPEDVTRQAWSLLTDEQRELANIEAENAIEYWSARRA